MSPSVPAQPSRPVVPSLCPVHLNHFRALNYRQSCSCKFAISNPSLLQNPCCLCPLLLLSDAPFLLVEKSSVFRHTVLVIFFTVIARGWHSGIIFLPFSVAMKMLRLLLVCVAAGGGEEKKSNESVKTSSLTLQHISVKWTLSSRQRLRTKAAQRKAFTLLLHRDTRGRGDKQREANVQPECCERGVCCSFMM